MILHLLTNDFRNDARVLRAAQCALDVGQTAVVLARHTDGLAEHETIGGVTVRRFRLVTRVLPKYRPVQLAKYLELAIRMVWAGIRIRPAIVHANDLSTLPIGYVITRLTGARLLYDSHELWSSILGKGGNGSPVLRPALRLERSLARKADAVITVSSGIAKTMSEELGIEVPRVIRNIPEPPAGFNVDARAPSPLRQSLAIDEDVPVVLYQGGMFRGRGLATLLAAMQEVRHPKAILVLLGNGPLVPELKNQVHGTPALRDRVRFLPAVPTAELLEWTRGATIGVHPIEGDSRNHQLCLPNKLFEYIHAGLPVLVSDMPEMKRLVEEMGLGKVFVAGNAIDLAGKLDSLLCDEAAISFHRTRVAAAQQVLTWKSERLALCEIYRGLLNGSMAGR